MKFKNLSLLFVLIFALSLTGFSQVDDEEAQMFGSKRDVTVKAFAKHDFGTLKTETVEHTFTIVNNNMGADLVISEFIIPDGVGVVLVDKVIKPRKEGKFIVTVNKNYLSEKEIKNGFSKEVVVTTVLQKPMGVTVMNKSTYLVKGKF